MSISKEKISKWLIYEHLKKMENMNLEEISSLYIGIYSSRPTSWQVVMSRNSNIILSQAISMEESENLIRIPGMRKSKFIMKREIAKKVFNTFKMDYSKHEWRLKEGNLTFEDYKKFIIQIKHYTSDNPKSLESIRKYMDINKKSIRSIVNFGTYIGDLLRIPTKNIWSNRWGYKSLPYNFWNIDYDLEKIKKELVESYLYQYGPVTSEDISWWMGIGKKEALSILKRINSKKLSEDFWIHSKKYKEFKFFEMKDENIDECKLLPAWDPILMGYSPNSIQRESLGLKDIGAYDKSGNGLPVIILGNQAVATWKIRTRNTKRIFESDLSHIKVENLKIINSAILKWCARLGVEYSK